MDFERSINSRILLYFNIIHILFVFTCNSSFAQKRDLRFEHISVEQGLSQSCVTSIIQDKKGYLWFGTSDGLNRYDGYDLTIYRHDPGDNTSLSDNSIETLFLDSKENLWIGTTKGGINIYNYKTGRFKLFNYTKNNPKASISIRVNTICEDKNGKIWIGSNFGFFEFDPVKNECKSHIQVLNNKYNLPCNYIKNIFIDHDNIMWIATAIGLNMFDPKTGKLISYFNDVASIYEDREGTLWLGTLSNGLIKYNKNTHESIYYKNKHNDPNSISSNNVRYIYEDKSGNIWIGTIKGLNRYNKKTNSFIRYLHQPEEYNSLSSDEHYCIFEDREGLLWFGTFGGGVNRLNLLQEAFVSYKHNQNIPGSLSDNFVTSICEDKQGNLWVGTDIGGLNKLNRETGNFIHFLHDPNNKNSLSSNTLIVINSDNSGNLWLGSFFGGLTKYDAQANKFIKYCFDPAVNQKCLMSDIITAIIEENDSTMWIGGREGLSRLNKITNTFTHFKHSDVSQYSLSDNSVNSLFIDKSGTLWIGTLLGGLNKFDNKAQNFKSYKYDSKSPKSVSSNYIIGICEDQFENDHILWIGTDNGLNKFDVNKEEFTRINVQDGLPNSCIYDIVQDHNRNLWLSTNNGLSKFNPVTGKFINFTVKDGLQGNEFNHHACYSDKNGYIYFGGMNGFNVFHPDNVKANIYKPKVVITSFKKFNKEIKFDNLLSEMNEIKLSYQDYVFSFEFASLSFTQPEKNQYAYKLEGFDQNWIYTDAKRRFATYTNLLPGEYIFKVKGSNNEGTWNDESTDIKIIILPPFWQTWWFRMFSFMSLIGIIFFIVWFTQTRKLRRKIEKLNQLQVINNERARISKDMHDEVGASLTKIHLIAGILTNENIDNKETKERIRKVHTFSEEVIQKLDEIVWTVSPKNDNLKNLLDYICEYTEEYLDLTDIATRYDIPAEIPDYSLTSEQRYNIFLVVKEGLNNIVKYSEATLVMLKVQLDKDCFSLVLEDNGKGFEINRSTGCGNGLKNMEERIDKIGGYFEINPVIGKGTKILVRISKLSGW